MTAAQPDLRNCRYTTYLEGTIVRCKSYAAISGYCRDHCPDHVARQHHTRVLTNKVLGSVHELIMEASAGDGMPTQQAVNNLSLAYLSLQEWRKL